MSMAASPSPSRGTPVTPGQGDACPGALRLHPADDGALARVRIPGGVLSTRQARSLAAAARDLGDGDLQLTSRGNVQLRGLRDGCGGELADRLGTAGLLPSPGHERVRNIVASPLSGLDTVGLLDVRPWLTALDAALCASDAARDLSGRFLFALDDGRGDMAGLGADITVRALSGGAAQLSPGGVRIARTDVAGAAVAAAEVFLEAGRDDGTHAWRVSGLRLPEEELAARVRRRLDALGVRHERRAGPTGTKTGPAPGVRGAALCVHVPFGRLSAGQWRALTDVAETELRLTPWRGVVIPAGGASAGASLARLEAAGLVTDAASPWLGVGACVGRPGCARALTDVRADAARTVDAAARTGRTVYWSGCERRCGHPGEDHIEVVAVPGAGYRISDTAGGPAAVPLVAGDADRVPAALAGMTS
ncbi:precorrin-3B synthase [Streptomyces sp. NPDC058459]|uniref:precorrin-3B synthase n=1 Tax=Streptomyces sp. NPDC058459 TaxID=3346508 RepID=UPI00366047E5